MYLTNDIALPVNSNPGMVFPPRGGGGNQEDAAGAGQHFVRDVAAFVNAVLDCKELIDRYGSPPTFLSGVRHGKRLAKPCTGQRSS